MEVRQEGERIGPNYMKLVQRFVYFYRLKLEVIKVY